MTTEEEILFAKKLEVSALRLKKIAKKLLGDEVLEEDLIRDTVCKAYMRRDKYVEIPGKTIEDWMASILKNIYYDQYLKRKSKVYFSPLNDSNAGVVENLYERQIEIDHQDHIIDHLAPHLQTTIRLYKHGYTYKEIAAIQGVKYGTVKQRKRRAIVGLQELSKIEI